MRNRIFSVGLRGFPLSYASLMPKVLLVKTSSLGDIIHNLPALTDLQRFDSQARVDWVVEPVFAAIPGMHPAVARTIKFALREWRRGFWRIQERTVLRAVIHELRRERYDAVIDTQGLIKSALIARIAHGTRYGLDWHSAREPLGLFYDKTFRIPWTLHAVERNRLLVASALGYQVPAQLDYGIAAAPRRFDWLSDGPYVVLLHATSDERKLWREEDWIALGSHFERAGLGCVLPSGNARERERSEGLARALRHATVAPMLAIDEIASLCTGANIIVGVDTGLTHLAAALRAPTVGIYSTTDPAATGIYGCPRAINVGSIGNPPSADAVIAAAERLAA
jgi:heptosyltransferase-1